MRDIKYKSYFHSVHLLDDKCKGCVNCIKRCPTEAIRVRDGKAHIIEERCIDCGECVRYCPNQAKTVITDSLAKLRYFRYNIALPAPALYGQFKEGTDPRMVIAGLLSLGFDYVVDVAFGADLVTEKIKEALQAEDGVRPKISSACPAVVRLIQVRFPNLVDNILPVITPMRASALIARHEIGQKLGVDHERIGVFFISPCPGKVSAIHDPEGYQERILDGAIGISEIYPQIYEILSKMPEELEEKAKEFPVGSGFGVGWARAGGEAQSLGDLKHIAVDGIHNVVKILEDVERGKLDEMDYIEAQACVGGCVGGVLTVENPFISRRRVRELALLGSETYEEVLSDDMAKRVMENEEWFKHDISVEPRPMLPLDEDMAEAIRKMDEMEALLERLPGLDCGSCGAPNCQALAEDVVRGLATETDCIFRLRDRVSNLANEMMELTDIMPPSMGPHQNGHGADIDTETETENDS